MDNQGRHDPERREAEEWLTFCYTRAFQNEWRAMGYRDRHLQELEIFLCGNPEIGVVMQGTGGLRKLRWALPGGGGKSGGCRIGYAYFRGLGRMLMVAIFAKRDQANFTAEEKAVIKRILEKYEHENG